MIPRGVSISHLLAILLIPLFQMKSHLVIKKIWWVLNRLTDRTNRTNLFFFNFACLLNYIHSHESKKGNVGSDIKQYCDLKNVYSRFQITFRSYNNSTNFIYLVKKVKKPTFHSLCLNFKKTFGFGTKIAVVAVQILTQERLNLIYKSADLPYSTRYTDHDFKCGHSRECNVRWQKWWIDQQVLVNYDFLFSLRFCCRKLVMTFWGNFYGKKCIGSSPEWNAQKS